MSIKIALAGNPNCGKTTLFNNLTGSNQYLLSSANTVATTLSLPRRSWAMTEPKS